MPGSHEGGHFNCVGKSKMGSHHEHSWGGGALPMERGAVPAPARARGGIARKTAEQLYFQLKEFDEFRQPSFNVLYVQTPRPFTNAPVLAALGAVVQETAELLAPLTRLGIPSNSIKDKLPYFREDYSPLPNTVRPRVQKVLRANEQFAEQVALMSAQAAEEWAQIKQERQASKDPKKQQAPLPVPSQLKALQQMFEGGHYHSSVHIHQPKFFTGEMPIWAVPALNFAAYLYICGFAQIDFWKGH